MLLRHLEALSRDAPIEEKLLRKIYNELASEIAAQLQDAYMVDVMWAVSQGKNAKFKQLGTCTTEAYDFDERRIYENSKVNGMMSYCYDQGIPIWITDPNGLRSKESYTNQFPGTDGTRIPSGTFYEYNKMRAIQTEICMPIKLGSGDLVRTCGVLNVEHHRRLAPSGAIAKTLERMAKVVALLQMRCESHAVLASTDPTESIDEERPVEPLVLSAFIAHAMNDPEGKAVHQVVATRLAEQGIEVAKIDSAHPIDQSMFKSIQRSHIGIAITSGFNRNVLIETGCFIGAQKPLILLHTDRGGGESYPFDVQNFVRHEIPYDRSGKLNEELLREKIDEALAAIKKSHPRISNLWPAGERAREQTAE